jgi:hypothetical protein
MSRKSFDFLNKKIYNKKACFKECYGWRYNSTAEIVYLFCAGNVFDSGTFLPKIWVRRVFN